MEGIFEITIIGRGGQGAKTASEVIATASLKKGKFIQAFSEYGAERSGAPILSYVRLSDKPITIHTSITEPDLVVVMDDTLLEMVPTSGKLIVNTVQSPNEIKQLIGLSRKVYTVDCTGISVEILGKNIPNTPTIGAIIKVTGILEVSDVENELRYKLESKIGKSAMDKNIECFNRAFNEVREG